MKNFTLYWKKISHTKVCVTHRSDSTSMERKQTCETCSSWVWSNKTSCFNTQQKCYVLRESSHDSLTLLVSQPHICIL